MKKILILIFFITYFLFAKNGFNLNNSLIPQDEILSGGPPKDGIPAIDNPQFIQARQAFFLKGEDEVMGVVIDQVAKAYPIKILNWHEVVNDKIASTSFVVTYCPLCGSGLVFNAKIKNQILSFGVSGLLYNSDVLLYDRQTESLWSQLEMKAVTGKFTKTPLTIISSTRTTWSNWKRKYPKTLVLSTKTGYNRNYTRDPYQGYSSSKRLFFPVNKKSKLFANKEKVLAITLGQYKKAYPFSELTKQNQAIIQDKLGNTEITIRWDKDSKTGEIFNQEGEVLPSFTLFWFAWYAFNSDGEVYFAR